MTAKIFTTAAAAIALTATPVLAQQSTAERLPAQIEAQSEQAEANGIILAVLAAAAVVAGLIIALDNNGENLPTSP